MLLDSNTINYLRGGSPFKFMVKGVKDSFRKKKLSLRDCLSPEEVTQKSKEITLKLLSLAEFQQAQNICFYAAAKREVATKAMIDYALVNRKKVILPQVRGSSLALALITDYEQDLEQGSYCLPEPKSSCFSFSKEDLDLVIVPGIVFDQQGNRIGYGRGYFDRFLAQTTAFKIGLAYDFQVVSNIPAELHDVPVDLIVTEKRIIRC